MKRYLTLCFGAVLYTICHAHDAIWERDFAACEELIAITQMMSCRRQAVWNREIRELEQKHAGRDPEFDRAFEQCLPLDPQKFPDCYWQASNQRGQRNEAKAAKERAAQRTASAAKKAAQQAQAKEEAQARAGEKNARAARFIATEPQRNQFAAEYQALLRRLYPNYNYLTVRIAPLGNSFALYGRHSFFNRYSFALGPEGPAIERWANERATRLRAADISQVGVESEDGGAVFFSLH